MALRRRVFALAAVLVLLGSACSDGDDDDRPNAIDQRLESLAGAGVFIGGVAMTNTFVAIYFEGQDKPSPLMRMYVAVGATGGAAEWFEGRADGKRFCCRWASGRAT